MKVILTSDVKNVGKNGEVVELSDAYARNCIISKKLGLEATPTNLNNLKLKKANDEKNAAKQLEEAKEFAKELGTKTITLEIKKGQDGRTFGSISSKEIAEAVKKQLGYDIDKKKITLRDTIKFAGDFDINVKVHPQVNATFKLVVNEK